MIADVNSVDYPHGTLEGVQGGCKNSWCPAVMKCRDVRIRYAGDFAFKKHLDAGLPVADFFVLEAEAGRVAVIARKAQAETLRESKPVREPRAPRPVKTAAERAEAEALRVQAIAERKMARLAKREAEIAERKTLTVYERAQRAAARAHELAERKAARAATRTPSPVPHGTPAGYARKCRCEPCVNSYRVSQRAYREKARARPIPEHVHGTAHGYQLGCKGQEQCPADPWCSKVSLDAETCRRREQGIPERVLVSSAPVVAHIIELHKTMTYVQIGAACGLNARDIRRMVTGRDSDDRRGELPKHTDQEKAEKILAVTA
jgi:hypothetical protein